MIIDPAPIIPREGRMLHSGEDLCPDIGEFQREDEINAGKYSVYNG